MNRSYKVALLVAALLCVIVVGYYALPGSSDAPPVSGADAAGADDVDDSPASVLRQRDRPATALNREGADDADEMAPTDEPASYSPPRPLNRDDVAGRDDDSAPFGAVDPTAIPPAEDPGIMDEEADAPVTGDDTGVTPRPDRSPVSIGPLDREPDPTPGTTPGTTVDRTAAVGTPGADEPDESDRTSADSPEPAADREPARPTPPLNIPAPLDTFYTVTAGDTLSSIADELYGSVRYWEDIARANPTVDPLRLRIGQELRLPGRQAIDRRQSSDTDGDLESPPAPGTLTHVVRPGETLSTIAQRYYSDSSRWRVIFNANRAQLGNDPDRITAGDELTIPPLPRN